MPDQTNITDFDPATGRTTTTLVSDHDRGAQDWATAEGESHDTWHQPDSGTPPPTGVSPTITSLDPNPVTKASGSVTLRVLGTGFVQGSVVNIASTDRVTTFVSATELTVVITVPPFYGKPQVQVKNPDGKRSSYFTWVIDEGIYPVLTSLSPTAVDIPPSTDATGHVPAPFTIFGTGFANVNPQIVVYHDTGSINYPATFVSETELLAHSFPPEANGPGQVLIGLKFANGTWSDDDNKLPLMINDVPLPTLTSLTPSTIPAGVDAWIDVVGTGFHASTVAVLDGNAGTGTDVSSSTTARFMILAAQAVSGTTIRVKVRNDWSAYNKDDSIEELTITVT
jgi:hypothetical protein